MSILIILVFICGIILGSTVTIILPKAKENKKSKGYLPKTITPSDQQVYNIVTDYGRYPEIWNIYRDSGWLAAIENRDEKINFDLKVSETRNNNFSRQSQNNQQYEVESLRADDAEVYDLVTDDGRYPALWEVYRKDGLVKAIKLRDNKRKLERNIDSIKTKAFPFDSSPEPPRGFVQDCLDELDLALLRDLALYFESMPDKIRHYHRDHNASQEEANVIAGYYLKTADMFRKAHNKQDLRNLIDAVEKLKQKVSPYQHESFKYRLSTGLEKNILEKLRKRC